MGFSYFLTRMRNATMNIEVWFLMNIRYHFSRIENSVSCGSEQSFYHGRYTVTIVHSISSSQQIPFIFILGLVLRQEPAPPNTQSPASAFQVPVSQVCVIWPCAGQPVLLFKVLEFMFLIVVYVIYEYGVVSHCSFAIQSFYG